VHDFAGKQESYGRDSNMRVWPDVHALARWEIGRPHLIEENEGSDIPQLVGRQQSADTETAQVFRFASNEQTHLTRGRSAMWCSGSEVRHRYGADGPLEEPPF
jgi:hypothetical protein